MTRQDEVEGGLVIPVHSTLADHPVEDVDQLWAGRAAHLDKANPLGPGLEGHRRGPGDAPEDRHDPAALRREGRRLARGGDAGVQDHLLSRVEKARRGQEDVRRRRPHHSLEERRREQHVGVGEEDVVAPEELAARPEGEAGAALVGGVLQGTEGHAAVGRSKGGPDHVLPLPDNQGRLARAGGLEAVKEAGEQTPAAQLDEPLGLLLGQRRQPLPDAGCEDQPDHGFGFRVCSSSNWSSSCLVFIFFTRSSYPVCWITRLNWVR